LQGQSGLGATNLTTSEWPLIAPSVKILQEERAASVFLGSGPQGENKACYVKDSDLALAVSQNHLGQSLSGSASYCKSAFDFADGMEIVTEECAVACGDPPGSWPFEFNDGEPVHAAIHGLDHPAVFDVTSVSPRQERRVLRRLCHLEVTAKSPFVSPQALMPLSYPFSCAHTCRVLATWEHRCLLICFGQTFRMPYDCYVLLLLHGWTVEWHSGSYKEQAH
jgi:hypothetical protein